MSQPWQALEQLNDVATSHLSWRLMLGEAFESHCDLLVPINPHRNKYRVISTPHLSDSYYQGASGSAWYLFANPNVLPAFEIVFLNGRRTPVIERVEMPANTLGMGFRSYIDFGVNSQDPRAAVKVTGE